VYVSLAKTQSDDQALLTAHDALRFKVHMNAEARGSYPLTVPLHDKFLLLNLVHTEVLVLQIFRAKKERQLASEHEDDNAAQRPDVTTQQMNALLLLA